MGQCYTGTFSEGFVDGEGVHWWEDGSSFRCTHSMGAVVSQGEYIAASQTAQPICEVHTHLHTYICTHAYMHEGTCVWKCVYV